MVSNIENNVQAVPQPSSIRRISGTQPGVLDPTQASRLLRLQGAKLSFAAFDPLTAYAQESPDLNKLNLNSELHRPKRVVIETAPSGECTWRFVPSAKRDEGVLDEGTWPRIVDVCGQLVEMTQDQWDIYKLDLHYECLVRRPSQLTLIQPASRQQPFIQPIQPTAKRQIGSHSPPPKRSMPPPQAHLESESDSDDAEEVELMVISDSPLPRRQKSVARERRERLKKEREKRREKIARKMEFFSPVHEAHMDIYPDGPTIDERPHTPDRDSNVLEQGKRKVTSTIDTLWSPDQREYDELRARSTACYTATSATKRTRNVPPVVDRREFRQKKLERSRLKEQTRAAEAEARRLAREKQLLDEIMEDILQSRTEDYSHNGVSNDMPTNSDATTLDDHIHSPPDTPEQKNDLRFDEDKLAHLAAIEESRKKLAELERDRSPWEEQTEQRQLREEHEEQVNEESRAGERIHVEAKRNAEAGEHIYEETKSYAEAEIRAQKEREDAEAEKREQEKSIERERELREQERIQRRQRWSLGVWTTQRALERYRVLAEAFDNVKYTPELPLVIEDVPWPSLQSPKVFSIEDVTWDSVERFFEAVRPHLRSQDYRVLVEKSHRRFHPDRWRSRNLLKTIEDEDVRGCMEVAANTVAQAITPLWRNLTGR